MERKSIEFEVCLDGRTITVPFDHGDGGQYEVEIYPDDAEFGDGVILVANREACLTLASIFGQLGSGHYPEGFHVHLGWEEGDVRGFKIVLGESGRVVRREDSEE